MKQFKLHLRRHLAARYSLLVGKLTPILNGNNEFAFLGNGVHPDGEDHLVGTEYVKAEHIGSRLHLPDKVNSVLVVTSPLARADETARHMFLGMARTYAQTVLGVDLDHLTYDGKRTLSKYGLHALAHFNSFTGLTETIYHNSQ